MSIFLHQIEDEMSNNTNIKIRCALYDKKVAGHSIQHQFSNHSACFCIGHVDVMWLVVLRYFQIVILKELKHSDGNFSETQRIELNAVTHTLKHMSWSFMSSGSFLLPVLY